jgi:hypothetical protein
MLCGTEVVAPVPIAVELTPLPVTEDPAPIAVEFGAKAAAPAPYADAFACVAWALLPTDVEAGPVAPAPEPTAIALLASALADWPMAVAPAPIALEP